MLLLTRQHPGQVVPGQDVALVVVPGDQFPIGGFRVVIAPLEDAEIGEGLERRAVPSPFDGERLASWAR
jgi:hypothetical protein